ncbi:MAG: Gfo/Idh/MocA family protein [Candidatus Nanopelagicales bacterium]
MRELRLPTARTPHPQEAPGIRWGILGPGSIARGFADAVASGTQSRVVAVGSRNRDRAEAFASQFGVERAHGCYEALVADDGIDAVYIASPHSEHHRHILLALAAGKPVLCEKAFTRNAAEAREAIAKARDAGLLLAEAMWSRYLPHYDVIRQAVDSGLLGDPELITADHGQVLYPDGPPRLRDPKLGGGSLLDLGVYPVSFADHLCGTPSSVRAAGALTAEGVDRAVGIVLAHAGGPLAVLNASMAAETPCSAVVAGTAARLKIAGRFYGPAEVRLYAPHSKEASDIRAADLPPGVRGMSYEVAEFARALSAGRTETDSVPLEATLRVMGTMDEIRGQIGVTYPGE